jgi:DNA polymerase IV
MVEYNQRIIKVLNRLVILRKIQAEEEHSIQREWESKANQRAVDTIYQLNYNICSKEEAMSLYGIGKGIGDHINQILSVKEPYTTGIPALDNLSKKNKDKINLITELIQIPGIGFPRALQMYNQGYRSVEEIITLLKSKGSKQYLEEIYRRIPRDNIDQFIQNISPIIKSINTKLKTKVKLEITGSYRRGLLNSGDIDAILHSSVKNDVSKFLPEFLKEINIKQISAGAKNVQGVIYLDSEFPKVRIDIFLVNDPKMYPFVLLYTTGSKTFNIQMRAVAKHQGYNLSNFELFDFDKKSVWLKDEQEIFAFFGLNYISPEERNL